MIKHNFSNEIRNRTNNWTDWERFGSIISAYLLDNPAEIQENIRLFKNDIFHKLAWDGHMPEETACGVNGAWYTLRVRVIWQ